MSFHAPASNDRIQQQPGPKETQSTQPNYHLQNIQKVLQHLVNDHTKLAKSREALVIERERLRTLSSKVRKKRIEAGNAEAAFMSRLRTCINGVHTTVPSSLIDAYNEVEDLRNDLGVVEEEFLHAERNLSGSEWRFQDNENEFYQFDLLDALEEFEYRATSIHHPEPTSTPAATCSAVIRSPAIHPMRPSSATGSMPTPISSQRLPPPPPVSQPLSSALLQTDQSGSTQGLLISSPPLVILHSPTSDSSASPYSEVRNHDSVVAELKALRRDFRILRKMRADQSDKIDVDLALLNNECEITPHTIEEERITDAVEKQPFFGMLRRISEREVEARSLRNEAMFRDIQSLVIARRRSDPGPTDTPPAPSVCMGRIHSEGALPTLLNYPKVEGWLREWLLQQFQDDALQQRIYQNISMHAGLESPDNGSWEDRAVRYWDRDHASDYDTQSDGGYDEGNENVLTRDTSHEPSVHGISMSFTQFDGHHSHLINSSQRLDVKPEGAFHVLQPRTTSLLSRTRLPNHLSSWPIPASRDTHSIGFREHLPFSPPRSEHLSPWLPESQVGSRVTRNNQQPLHDCNYPYSVGVRDAPAEIDCNIENSTSCSTEKSHDVSPESSAAISFFQSSIRDQTTNKEILYETDVPTALAKHVKEESGRSNEAAPRNLQSRTSQTLEIAPCGSSSSDAFVLEVWAPVRCKSDCGAEKLALGRRERFGEILPDLRHHRRLSESYIFDSRETY